MLKFTETVKNKRIIRNYYEKEVYITYEPEGDNEIYVPLLYSKQRGKGSARLCFVHFCKEFEDKVITIKVTDDFGADLKMLDTFYRNLGFVKTANPTIYKKG